MSNEPLVMGTKEVESTCPFDGQFNKCNNAEGCDFCKEYDEWLKAATIDETNNSI